MALLRAQEPVQSPVLSVQALPHIVLRRRREESAGVEPLRHYLGLPAPALTGGVAPQQPAAARRAVAICEAEAQQQPVRVGFERAIVSGLQGSGSCSLDCGACMEAQLRSRVGILLLLTASSPRRSSRCR